MIRLLLVSFQVVGLAALAAGPPLDSFCGPFGGQGVEVLWNAPTNDLPQTVRVLRVVPTMFSPTVVSNLLDLAGLKSNQRRRSSQNGVFADKDAMFFGDKTETRYLGFVPSQGFIVLNREDVLASPRQSPVGVPTQSEALERALALVPKLGVKMSELVAGTDGKPIPLSLAEGSRISRDKSSGKTVTNIVRRSLSFGRKIGEIPVWTGDSVSIKFGDHAQVSYLSVTWRSVEPYQLCRVPSPAEFVDRIKTGKALIRHEQNGSFKKATITKVSLYYWENSGSEPQRFIYPFAVLEAEIGEPDHKAKTEIFVCFANE